MKKIVLLCVVILVAMLTGCASVPMASLDQDSKAKDFTPRSEKATLFIYRNETFGAAIPVTVSVNERTIGQTASKTYFRFNINPGRYKIKAHAENVAELSVDAVAGRNYFIWQEMKMGMWTARAKLTQVDDSTGRSGVSESKLIASTVSDQELETTVATSAPAVVAPAGVDLTAAEKLRELQKLKDEGVISESEFEEKKVQFLDKL